MSLAIVNRSSTAPILLALTCLALAGCDPLRGVQPSRADARAPADLLIRDAAVYTLDDGQPWAEALTVHNGLIRYVGSLDGALAEAGPATEVISMPGGLVLPGFQDAHSHPYISGLDHFDCGMFEVESSPESYAARARECYDSMPERDWISGAGWSPTAFGAEPRPDKRLLDAAVPDKPAVFFSDDGHTAWANSRALEAAGIARDTPDPPNGRIDRDPVTGEPSGSLQESAMLAMRELLPPPSAARREAAMVYMRDYLHSLGITAVQVAYASIDPGDPQRALQTFREFADRGALQLRTVISLLWDQDRGLEQIDDLIAARDRFSGGLVQANTVKLFLDGVVEPHTAALIDDYSDRPGYRGIAATVAGPGHLLVRDLVVFREDLRAGRLYPVHHGDYTPLALVRPALNDWRGEVAAAGLGGGPVGVSVNRWGGLRRLCRMPDGVPSGPSVD